MWDRPTQQPWLNVYNDTGSDIADNLLVVPGTKNANGFVEVEVATKPKAARGVWVARGAIPNGGRGRMLPWRIVEDVNTSGATEGDPIYLGASGAWALTGSIVVGYVMAVSATAGVIMLAPRGVAGSPGYAIGGLDDSDGNFIVGSASGWVTESGATARTSLGVAIGSDVQAYSAELGYIVSQWAVASDGDLTVPSGWTLDSTGGITINVASGADWVLQENAVEVGRYDGGTNEWIFGAPVVIEDNEALTGFVAKPSGDTSLTSASYVSIMAVTLPADGWYSFRAVLSYAVNASDDIRFRLSGTGTIVHRSGLMTSQSTVTGTTPINVATDGGVQHSIITGTINAGASGGTLTLEASKQTDVSTNGTVYQYSSWVLERVE